ncbi:Aste57867_5966 [Aphanomyces stellatus]|uniref:Aste57867_5966 protein n=1 Tax=Aphanomyces stellatus TaxID=120398 RepID=A0A485KEY9_9STRA|nr:hypothetical protein As57867_005952 [Aphanomyces stellatus]VFT82983.1 Aste57867_5966 [Aphanomyces stellatus]
MKTTAMHVFVATLLLVLGAPAAATSAQRADPNAIQKCTDAVTTIQNSALFNPAAITCAKAVPDVTINGDSSKGLMAFGKQKVPDATVAKVAAAPDCITWYSALTATIVAYSPPCTFQNGATTATTDKYATTIASFLASANNGTGTALTSTTTTAPPTGATTAAPKGTPGTGTTAAPTANSTSQGTSKPANDTATTKAPATTAKSSTSTTAVGLAAAAVAMYAAAQA